MQEPSKQIKEMRVEHQATRAEQKARKHYEGGATHGGKGSRNRSNPKKYAEGLSNIDWSKKAPRCPLCDGKAEAGTCAICN